MPKASMDIKMKASIGRRVKPAIVEDLRDREVFFFQTKNHWFNISMKR